MATAVLGSPPPRAAEVQTLEAQNTERASSISPLAADVNQAVYERIADRLLRPSSNPQTYGIAALEDPSGSGKILMQGRTPDFHTLQLAINAAQGVPGIVELKLDVRVDSYASIVR